MSSSDRATYEDPLLIRYLTGALPESDTERLDELSLSNEEFAIRLEAVENDLVDSWARGELAGEMLEQFNRTYLSSPERLSKLRFAQALVAQENRSGAKSGSVESAVASTSSSPQNRLRSVGSQTFPFPGWFPKWAPVAIALLALVSSAYLAMINGRLRRELTKETAQRQTLEAKQQKISHELAAQSLETKNTQQITASQQPSSDQPHLISVLLLPAMRGANGIATVSIPAHAEHVRIRLQIEADDFPAYRAALRDSSLNQIAWHKEHLKAGTEKARHVISLDVPAGLLKEHNYLFELTGVRTSGEELLATYPFRVAAK